MCIECPLQQYSLFLSNAVATEYYEKIKYVYVSVEYNLNIKILIVLVKAVRNIKLQ